MENQFSIKKQVEKSHYNFESYMTKARWNSVWHQLNEVVMLNPTNILEVGMGSGLFKNVAKMFGLEVETIDIDSELHPDHVGSVTSLPFSDATYDVICAFQVLEHLPYDHSLIAFNEMARCSRKSIIISLPDAELVRRYKFHIPKYRSIDILLPWLLTGKKEHQFDGEHYWEINKAGYPLKRIITDLSSKAKLIKTYRVLENPYHRFFIFEKS